MIQRGILKNRERARQLHDYSGLRFHNMTPMNLDGSMDFGGKAFVFLEYKLRNAPLPMGEQIHLENLTDAIYRAGLPAIAILAIHVVDDPKLDIDGADAEAFRYRYREGWRIPRRPMTVRQLIEAFLSHENLNGYLSERNGE